MDYKELRLLRGMTREQLAESLNVDTRTVTELENGAVLPSVRVTKKMADILNIEWACYFPD